MFFLTPKYVKQAKLLDKGVTKFLHYKKDLLPDEKIGEIQGFQSDLRKAAKARDREAVETAAEKVTEACEKCVPTPANASLRENVEVIFVAVVIALGVRTYIAQPFRIPTGSMQPTLNGKITTHVEEWDDEYLPKPNPLARLFHLVVSGRSYIDVIAKHDGPLDSKNPITETSVLKFFPMTVINYADGKKQRIFAPRDKALGNFRDPGLGLGQALGARIRGYRDPSDPENMRYAIDLENSEVEKGQVLARGILQTGDQVLVNKFAYHFRKPKRGEVFVFRTEGIRAIRNPDPRMGSQHYIKRLVGVPGDELEVRAPKLFIDGAEAAEPNIRRVWSGEDNYAGYTSDGATLKIKLSDTPGREQYWAMGDNSANSSDSRMWGPVPERNVVGPGLFVYWPFTSHWGRIE